MQQVVAVTMDGKAGELTLRFLIRLDGAWVPIDQLATHNVRVLQIIESTRSGWFALIERATETAA